MDKLQMAMRFAEIMLIEHFKGNGVYSRNGYKDEICEDAWVMADAMQAEADKRNYSEKQDSSEWQPDWSQAPDEANYWAMDGCGQCNWYEREPEVCGSQWDWGGVIEQADTGYDYQGKWQDSLRKRPQ